MTHIPRPFLLGTDWWTDVDDVVALRVLAHAHKAGKIALEGVCINACMAYSCPSVDAFLQNEGLPGVPIGVDREATGYGGKPPYQKRMAQSPGNHRTNDECLDAVRLYRQTLARAETQIEIAEIGFCQVLAAVLRSPPDEFSPLPGHELLRQKCKHIWAMAGRWDAPDGGYEYNLSHTAPNCRAASEFYENCPVPVTFLGFEAGLNVITGDVLKGRDDMLARALKDHGSENGRHSWDPMLALLALAGEPEQAGYRAVYGQAKIDPADGKNTWIADENGSQRYVIKTRPDRFYRDAIHAMIL
ncbi:MAG: hypothetical protein FWC27_02615 [Firmicutes bacterium]|nr:hypothetical protein [Bacillota bacterium]